MNTNTITAARKVAEDLRQQVSEIDSRLAAFERAEQEGDPALPALAGARLLVSLSDLSDHAGELVEVLDEYAEDLPAVPVTSTGSTSTGHRS